MADEESEVAEADSNERETESIHSRSPRFHIEHVSLEQLDEIAKKLLESRLFLTALEFHAELIEYGRELTRLKDFFSNPSNFEMQMKLDPLLSVRKTPSVLTLDSIDDFARYSDDGIRDVDEKVTVLEFELRKAKETIHELRQSVTELTADKKDKSVASSVSNEPINPYEIRTLNFLVNQYLLKRENKLTSITFADEAADQDLDDWEDVGLNTEQPPDLLNLLRDFSKHVVDPVKMRTQELDQLRNEINNLGIGAETMTNTCTKLENNLNTLETEKQNLTKELEELSKKNISFSRLHVDRKYRSDDDNLSLKSNTSNLSGNSLTNIRVEITNEDEIKDIPENNTNVTHTKQMNKKEIQESDSQEILDSNIVPVIATDENSDSDMVGTVESEGSITSPTSSNDLEKTDDSLLNRTHIESPDNDSIDIIDARPNELTISNNDQDRLISTPDVFYERLTTNTEKCFVSKKFFEALYSMTQTKGESRLSKEVSQVGELDPIYVIANSLPNIVPNVLLNKREELIPLILCAVRYHTEPKARDELLHTLFNLIKRPDKDQRRIIIDGCVSFAKTVEAVRIEAEFLPQCWEQINHKFVERRLLVSETCGCMAPFIPVELLSSLIFSMFSQMLQEDRSEEVRCSIIKNLSLICSFLTDSSKYIQTYSLLELGLNDIVDEVLNDTKYILFPVIGVWALKINKFQTHLIPNLLRNCHQSLQTWHDVSLSSSEDGDSNATLLAAEKKFNVYIECLVNSVTISFLNCLQAAPFYDEVLIEYNNPLPALRIPVMKNTLLNVETIIGDSLKLNSLVNKFDDVMKKEEEIWEGVSWICDECISKACEMSVLTLTSHAFIEKIICYLCTICRIFGRKFTYIIIVPYFEKLMRNTGAAFLNDSPPVCSPILTLFLCGVLATYHGMKLHCADVCPRTLRFIFTSDEVLLSIQSMHNNTSSEEEQEKKLFTFLKQCLQTISTQGLSTQYLTLSINFLSKNTNYQFGLIQMLRETIVYPVAEVRITACHLFEVLVKCVNKDLLSTQVAPSIISLTNDRDGLVKLAAVPALGSLLEVINEKNLLDKVSLQFQMLLDDPSSNQQNVNLRLSVLKTFTKLIPSIEYKFRDEFLIPRLRVIAETNNLVEDLNDRIDVAEELIHALGAALCCFLSKEVILSYVIPTLKCLETDLKDVSPETLDSVVILMRDAESKSDDDKSSTGSGVSSSTSRLFGGISSRLDKFKKKK